MPRPAGACSVAVTRLIKQVSPPAAVGQRPRDEQGDGVRDGLSLGQSVSGARKAPLRLCEGHWEPVHCPPPDALRPEPDAAMENTGWGLAKAALRPG